MPQGVWWSAPRSMCPVTRVGEISPSASPAAWRKAPASSRAAASRVGRSAMAGPYLSWLRDATRSRRRHTESDVFDSLADKLQGTLNEVRSRGTLTEADITAAMREIRLALLEADVNFKVVKSFTNAVKERALGADVLGQLNPGQQVVKIVSDELTDLMGGAAR